MADVDDSTEIWRDIPGHEGRYRVSDQGRVANSRTGHLLQLRVDRGGYLRSALSGGGKHRQIPNHQAVMLAFIGPKPDNHEVNHINNVRTDNRVGNLEWVTRQQNTDHREAFGHSVRGEGNGRARLTVAEVKEIRRRRAAGELLTTMAKEFNVHKNTIRFAASGGTWPNI